MRTVRITVEKEGAKAVCTNRYFWNDHPETSRWTGDRKAFTWPDGSPLEFRCGLDQLPQACAYQCAQCAATFTIEDLGGESMMWTDEVFG